MNDDRKIGTNPLGRRESDTYLLTKINNLVENLTFDVRVLIFALIVLTLIKAYKVSGC